MEVRFFFVATISIPLLDDGTLNEVVDGMVKRSDKSMIPVGIISSGSREVSLFESS